MHRAVCFVSQQNNIPRSTYQGVRNRCQSTHAKRCRSRCCLFNQVCLSNRQPCHEPVVRLTPAAHTQYCFTATHEKDCSTAVQQNSKRYWSTCIRTTEVCNSVGCLSSKPSVLGDLCSHGMLQMRCPHGCGAACRVIVNALSSLARSPLGG